MLNIFKKNAGNTEGDGKILAPFNGEVIAISECEDEVFAEKVLGDGVAVIPDGKSDTVLSPVNGKVVNVIDTLHAYGIESNDGIELLIHIGINTVELEGKGFKSLVKVGDSVKAGQPICKVDFNLLTKGGYPLQTPVLITDMSEIGTFEMHTGTTEAGKTCIIEYTKK